MRRCLTLPLIGLALIWLTLPALARSRVTMEEMRIIAFDKGIVEIQKIALDHGIWEVKGRDATGHKIRIEVEAATGEIVKIKRH